MPHFTSYFRDQIYNLRHIHGEVAAMKNGLFINKPPMPDWDDYSPSNFLYAFVCFNTLYDIDWESSYHEGSMVRYRDMEKDDGERVYESDMQENYIRFCFSDNDFVERYKPFFIKFILTEGHGDIGRMMEIIKTVRFGTKFKDAFIKNFESLLSGDFEEKTIRDITNSLYHVRCNIFHGTKSIKELGKNEQQKRLAIYTSFFIALNQMLFSYLDYLDPSVDFIKKIEEDFQDLTNKRRIANRHVGKRQPAK